ncbi:putative ATP-dependent helicase hrq1 [Smittium culicis]|uniref:Putative ATP-dependent helicase hrq1 n=1 Tax=Smittium culicis TaxID=133412 RepID=A0A1R1YDJ0_9FUNG|nr:putative ATP-dependent helicase hrq1 [Smittium culicis]
MLDTVVIVGSPLSKSEFMQKIGRCGRTNPLRKKQMGNVVLILGSSRVDSMVFMNNKKLEDSKLSMSMEDLVEKLGYADTKLMKLWEYSNANISNNNEPDLRLSDSNLQLLGEADYGIGGNKSNTDVLDVGSSDSTVLDEFRVKSISVDDDIVIGHLQCAAFEIPLAYEKAPLNHDCKICNDEIRDFVKDLKFDESCRDYLVKLCEKTLIKDASRSQYVSSYDYRPYPAMNVDLRKIKQNEWSLVKLGSANNVYRLSVLENMDGIRASREIYIGSVHLYMGDLFVVDDILVDKKLALVSRLKYSYHTKPAFSYKLLTTRKSIAISKFMIGRKKEMVAKYEAGKSNKNFFFFIKLVMRWMWEKQEYYFYAFNLLCA